MRAEPLPDSYQEFTHARLILWRLRTSSEGQTRSFTQEIYLYKTKRLKWLFDLSLYADRAERAEVAVMLVTSDTMHPLWYVLDNTALRFGTVQEWIDHNPHLSNDAVQPVDEFAPHNVEELQMMLDWLVDYGYLDLGPLGYFASVHGMLVIEELGRGQ